MQTDSNVLLMKYLLALLLLTSCGRIPTAEPSCTFIQNEYGERVSWYYAPVVIGIDASVPINLQPAIYAAALQWNQSYGSELIRVVPYHTDNMIYWQTTWTNDPNQEAYTMNSWYDYTIYQSNIYINAAIYQFYYGSGAGVEFKSLMIHEMGHVLGLAHSDGVMSPSLSYNTVRWDIDSKILNNLKCEY